MISIRKCIALLICSAAALSAAGCYAVPGTAQSSATDTVVTEETKETEETLVTTEDTSEPVVTEPEVPANPVCGDYEYVFENGSAKIVKYQGSDTEVKS